MKDLKKIFEQYLSFVKKYIPEPKVQSSIGIDIGLSTCKMVEVKAKGSSFELVQWGIEPFKNENPAEAIKTLLGRTSNPHYLPATAVHGKGTLIRYIELPRMSLEELKKSFVYEADKYLPFTSDQIYLDCMILDPKGKGSKMTVMVAAAKREIVDERVNLLKKIDIDPDFITLNSIAIANVIKALGTPKVKTNDAKISKDEAMVVVDIGEKVTSITVVYDALPHFTRDIFIAGNDFTKYIAAKLDVSLEEAERLKCDPGKQREEIVKLCESVALDLISEMRLSFDYFVTEHNIPITRILLSGGASLFDGMADLFKKYLEVEIVSWDPFEHVEIPAAMKDEAQKISGQLGVALGLSLF